MRITPLDSLFPLTRQWLADEAQKVERLIDGMPESKKDEYRSSSKPHRALREFDALVSHVGNVQELLREWFDLGDLPSGGYNGTLRYRTEAELGRLTVAE